MSYSRATPDHLPGEACCTPFEEEAPMNTPEYEETVITQAANDGGSPSSTSSSGTGSGSGLEGTILEGVEDDRRWYVIHTYSGYENKVKKNLEHRILSHDISDRIFRVEVPTVEEIEIRSGQRQPVQRKMVPRS